MKVHYGTTEPLCKVASNYKVKLSSDRSKVTCFRCMAGRQCRQCKKTKPIAEFPSYVKDGEPRRRTTCGTCRGGPDSYGDNGFKGLGRLRCTLCGIPYRDHRIGPCPRWGDAA